MANHKKYPCPDCRMCQMCSDERCELCLGTALRDKYDRLKVERAGAQCQVPCRHAAAIPGDGDNPAVDTDFAG